MVNPSPSGQTRKLDKWIERRHGKAGAQRCREVFTQALDQGLFAGQDPERVLASLALVAGRSLTHLDEALALLRTDVRDLLVSAGLGQDDWRSRLAQLLAHGD